MPILAKQAMRGWFYWQNMEFYEKEIQCFIPQSFLYLMACHDKPQLHLICDQQLNQ